MYKTANIHICKEESEFLSTDAGYLMLIPADDFVVLY